MVEARALMLEQVAEVINSALLNQDDQPLSVHELGEHIEKLQKLEGLAQMVSKTPVWPFRIPNVVSFFISTYVPTLLPIAISAADVIIHSAVS